MAERTKLDLQMKTLSTEVNRWKEEKNKVCTTEMVSTKRSIRLSNQTTGNQITGNPTGLNVETLP